MTMPLPAKSTATSGTVQQAFPQSLGSCPHPCPSSDAQSSKTPSLPHPRTFHTGLVRGDGGTLDSHTVLLCGQRRVNGDLVIGLVTMWEPEVKILELDVHVGQNELARGQGKM